jgi:hypothetical protein
MRRNLLMSTLVLAGAMTTYAPAANAQAPKLKVAVTLSGANNTADTLELQAAPGPISRDLDFYPTTALDPSPSEGRLAVTNLRATTAPGDSVIVKAGLADGSESASDGAMFTVELKVGQPLRIRFSADGLRAGATYKGRIVLQALKETREWEVTVTTGTKTVLVADPIPALQFQRSLWAWTCSWWDCDEPIGTFSFSLRPKTPIGSLTGLHARFEPSATTASKTLRSNFAIDSFSFVPGHDPLGPDGTDPCGGRTATLPGGSLTGPVWIAACVSRLEPGEYAGALRFIADEVQEDSADSRLALAINVRDPRAIPIAVLVIGAIIGWFTTKYLTAARKARDMARVVQRLTERANDLMKTSSGRPGWGFADESVSLGLMRVRVALKRLTSLTKTGMPMLVEEAELTRVKDEAEIRLVKLESLREVRVKVEQTAQIQPTIQRVVGRLLRDCSGLLAQSQFGTNQQTACSTLIEEIRKWGAEDTFLATYRAALIARSEAEADINASDFPEKQREHVKGLLNTWPTAAQIAAATAGLTALHEFDERFEKLSLLNRERSAAWAQALFEASSTGTATLRQLFDLADEAFWKALEAEQSTFSLSADTTNVDCYDVVGVRLVHPTIEPSRLLVHPLRLLWKINLGTEERTVHSQDLSLVQFFTTPGTAQITARLEWGGRKPIDLPAGPSITVRANPDYDNSQLFLQGGGLEYTAVAIATAFAVVTAMQSQYDSTFGSPGQYLALFLWAAGAASGGNILKQLGTNNSPGGQADAALPAKS